MNKVWWQCIALLVLLVVSAGCGSNLSTSSSERGFSNPDTARGLILSLLGILDGFRPLGTGPTATCSVNRIYPFDSEHFDVVYNVTSTSAAAGTTVSFYTTVANAHAIILGSLANKCTVVDDGSDGYTITYNGKSSTLHSPELTYNVQATGTSGSSTSIVGTILVTYSVGGENLATGTVAETFTGSDVHLFLTIYETNAFGGTGSMVLEYQPSASYFNSHVISDKPGIGRVTIAGTTSFNGEYFFNTDYAFGSNLARIR